VQLRRWPKERPVVASLGVVHVPQVEVGVYKFHGGGRGGPRADGKARKSGIGREWQYFWYESRAADWAVGG